MAICPSHETQTIGLSRDDIEISFQICMDDNCSSLNHLNADGKKALQAEILKATLDIETEKNVSLIPRDVYTTIVESGCISGRATLTLQDWDTSMRAI